jgi:hypothetical protein
VNRRDSPWSGLLQLTAPRLKRKRGRPPLPLSDRGEKLRDGWATLRAYAFLAAYIPCRKVSGRAESIADGITMVRELMGPGVRMSRTEANRILAAWNRATRVRGEAWLPEIVAPTPSPVGPPSPLFTKWARQLGDPAMNELLSNMVRVSSAPVRFSIAVKTGKPPRFHRAKPPGFGKKGSRFRLT